MDDTRENAFIIAPVPGGYFTFAKAFYTSVCGMVTSGWEREDGVTAYTVTIPVNCTALVRLPDGSERIQGPGTVTYRV